MKTAEEMRKTSMEVIEKMENEKRTKAKSFIEEAVAPVVESKANEGKTTARISVWTGVDADEVTLQLKEIGYEAETWGCFLEIDW